MVIPILAKRSQKSTILIMRSLLLLLPLVSGSVVELTKENFASTVEGKQAFVKFLAPVRCICILLIDAMFIILIIAPSYIL